MAEKSINSPRLDSIHIVLILAACFAIGSVGFFLAVFLGNASGIGTASSAPKVLTAAQKTQILDSVSVSSASPSTSSSDVVATPSTPGSGTQTVATQPASSQNAQNSSSAAKLKILDSLNSSQ